MKLSRYFFIALILVGIFLLGFSAGQQSFPVDRLVPEVTHKSEGQPAEVDFSIFWRTWQALQENYLDADKLDPQQLVYGAVKGMVRAVGDPYTSFLDPEESKNFSDTISGSFEGIGAEIGIRDNRLTIIAPLKNTPAEKAGLKAGDQVLEIDGVPTEGMSLEEAVTRIKGPKGTKVVLTIVRNGLEQAKKVEVVRDKIDIPVLDWELKQGNIAYIQLYTFTENVAERFDKAANQILQAGADKIVLDLRNNAGGVLQGAIRVAGWFVPKGKIVVIEEGKTDEVIDRSPGPGSFSKFKTVVLVNQGSASASEIVAGALQEQAGATLVGLTTFGKGSVQALRRFPDRSTLKVTVARWFTPQRKQISEKGIKPDIQVEMEPDQIGTDQDIQLQKALELVQQKL